MSVRTLQPSPLARLQRRSHSISCVPVRCLLVIGLLAGSAWFGQPIPGQTIASSEQTAPGCLLEDRFFEEEVWAKVGERTCLKCHNKNGEAGDSRFLLSDTAEGRDGDQDGIELNRQAFLEMAITKEGDRSRMLLKVIGEMDHGGGQILKPESSGYRILERFVQRTNGQISNPAAIDEASDYHAPPFFDGITMISPKRLLRRATLSLAGRLPTSDELTAVDQQGLTAMDSILDKVMQEDAFYVRLKEGFNDIFLTVGIEDNAETLLSYEHFEMTRHWTEKHDLNHVPEADRQKARWKLADVYRDALLREPLELIAYIVQHDRPFSELATADYIMVTPYTARGYGIFEELKDQFKNVEEPFEYIPAKLNALKSREGHTQESASGLYPHAGFLSMFHYLHRYPSTETNRNRLRARMFYQHFLGIDIMQLAPRVTDASAVAAKYEIPTMQASDCVVCHKTIDPVAGLFQDFNLEGDLGPRRDGWYTDMFSPGFQGEDLPSGERWRAPQWLGERVVKDPRFPVAMVEHVYYILLGRRVLQPPEDIDDPMFGGKRRAYRVQRQMIDETATKLAESGFNLKVAFKAIIASEFYRVDGLAAVAEHPQEAVDLMGSDPLLMVAEATDGGVLASTAVMKGSDPIKSMDRQRLAELDDLGVVRLLSPEQLERKLLAIFGKPWGRLEGEYQILYGGIDSKTVTERNADPGGAMGAIQRIMANDVACNHVARDFILEPEARLLFPTIEPTVIPGDDVANKKIREAIVHLHQRLLGHERLPEHPEVERTFQLFSGILADAEAQESYEPRETYFCGGRDEFRVADPHYTIRAWRGVVTYLLRQQEFLYE